MNFTVLNSKETKRIATMLEQQYGWSGSIEGVLLLNENKGRLYLLSGDAAECPFEELRIDSIGLYLGTIMPGGQLRLSIEGSQIVGPGCTKRVLVLDQEQAHTWIRGQQLALSDGFSDGTGAVSGVEGEHATANAAEFIIIASEHPVTGARDYLGCGKIVEKEEAGRTVRILLNYIPKTRSVRADSHV